MIRKVLKRFLLFVCAPLLCFMLLGGGALWYYINFSHNDFSPSDVDVFLGAQPEALTEILDDEGAPIIELPAVSDWRLRTPMYRRTVKFGDMPDVMIRAALAAEDQRFFSHSGIDYQAIVRAAFEVFKESARESFRSYRPRMVFAEGGSTITQQVVRLTFLEEDLQREQKGEASRMDKIRRKIHEARRAVWLERRLSEKLGHRIAKERIFEAFANISYCGHGRYGFGACSIYYFGTPIKKIAVPDAALLAGMVRDPWEYSPRVHPGQAVLRRNTILRLMAEQGNINPEDEKRFVASPLRLVSATGDRTIAPSVVKFVLQTLWGMPNSATIRWESGATIRTTIKRSWQIEANDALEKGLDEYRKRHPDHAKKIQGAFVVIDSRCRVKALVGGSHATYTSFNRATEARRQPGSAFKPFDYLAALEDGFEWSFTINDAPVSVSMGRGRPRHIIGNYDGRFFGRIPMWQGLAESRNGATARLGMEVGTKKIVEVATRLGLNPNMEDFPTTTIGAEEVTPLELACAYAAFANGGFLSKPLIVEEVATVTGGMKYASERMQVLETDIASKMVEGLRHTVTWRKGTGRSLLKLNIPVFGKTGTTNDFRDAWFCGSTFGDTGVTACVWIGMDDRTPLGEPDLCRPRDAELRKHCEPGAVAALPIFEKFMSYIYRDASPEPLPEGMEERMEEAHRHGIVRD